MQLQVYSGHNSVGIKVNSTHEKPIGNKCAKEWNQVQSHEIKPAKASEMQKVRKPQAFVIR